MTTATARPRTEREEPLVGNYFVAAYPPFSFWTPQGTRALDPVLQRPSVQPGPDPQSFAAPLGLYVHVPFCHKKCDYCYYLSYVGERAEIIDAYIDSVARELEMYAAQPAVKGRSVAFVYFGGGTPSILAPRQIRRLTEAMKSALSWERVPEVTFECAPRSVCRELLEELRSVGVTRLSMGVQSFHDDVLKLNGRVHLVEHVYRAYNLIREAGFDYVNLDLMVGLMGESPEQWRESVDRMLELLPESVTIYQTEIPYNTVLYQQLSRGCLPAAAVPWEVKRWRLDKAFSQLEQGGYTVVSAYTAVRDPDRHHFEYQEHLWRGGDMLGLGVASFSYFQGVHFQNEVTLQDYTERVRGGALPLNRAYELSAQEQLVREFILQLKLGEVSVPAFQKKFGADVRKVFEQPLHLLMAEGHLICTERAVQLTCQGLLQADRLLPFFYDPRFRDARYT